MKKLLATTLLTTFTLGLIAQPVSAITDKNQKNAKKQIEQTQSILGRINYDWWQNINDPYLEDYILRAVQNNHDVKTAQLNLERAEINVLATRANQLPTLGIGAAPVLAKMPSSTKSMGSIALPIFAQYELDLFGKNWDKTKSAKKLLQGVQYQTTASDIAIMSYVGTTYYNIVKLDKIIELQEKIIEDRGEIYKLMNISNKEGITSTQDVIQAEKSYVLAQNDMIEYQKSRINALNALAVLIGDSPNNINEYKRINFDDLKSDFKIPHEISSEIITNRPDYKSLEHQLEAAGIDVRVAKKEFLPTIDILGAIAFLAISSASAMDWKNAVSFAAGNVTMPLFTGFLKTANLRLNKNKYAQLLEQYQKANLVAIQEVNDSLYNYKSDNEKFQNNQKALDIQTKDFKLANAKYNQGVISKLDLLQQRESLLFMEQLSANSKMGCYIDKIGLYKTTGAQI
ncbi:MAG: TolC family protein [Candidatus Gastranaerophilales bacterium]|nr:TolC family protein [Candidatus Gastranaerophilales bacterium]